MNSKTASDHKMGFNATWSMAVGGMAYEGFQLLADDYADIRHPKKRCRGPS